MVRNGLDSAPVNFARTPRSSRMRTPGGITPSPQALSATLSCRSSTATESPRRAASMATASPAGPAPTTATSSESPTEKPRHEPRAIAECFVVRRPERAFLLANADRENEGVGQGEDGGSDDRSVYQRNARDLDGDG